MSIVAISQTLGSLGDEIGRRVADTLSYEFADREIILQAAERFGQALMSLRDVTEEQPSLWERFTATQRRYGTCAEAIVRERAARNSFVGSRGWVVGTPEWWTGAAPVRRGGSAPWTRPRSTP